MRIGIDVAKALGPPDGIATYTAGLLAGLAEVDSPGSYRLYGLSANVDRAALEARVGPLPASFEVMPPGPPRAGEVEVFHAPAHQLPRLPGTRMVFTLHDLTFLSHPGFHTLGNRLLCLQGLCRALAQEARLVAVSENTRRDALARLAVPPTQLAVVPGAVGAEFHPREAAEVSALRARLGLERPYLLALGVLEPRKNLRRLVEAFAALPEPLRRARQLVVAGRRGWLAEGPESWPEAQALGEQLRLLGEVAGADLPALYSGADAFAYPSLYEGFGLPPLEAMACGAPVLTSRISSLPEVVGEAAVLVDPERVESIRDGLAELLGSAELRQRLRAAGLERARLFTWQKTARAMVEIYREGALSREV
ncbi:MAG: glycosyltransferase family 1 protein [Thermoanaerobaculia bacterium]